MTPESSGDPAVEFHGPPGPALGRSFAFFSALRAPCWQVMVNFFSLRVAFWLSLVRGFTFFLIFLRFEKSISRQKENLFFKSLAWLGQISFSLYLIHFPLFKLFGFIHRSYFKDKPANFIITLAYLVPVDLEGKLFHFLANILNPMR